MDINHSPDSIISVYCNQTWGQIHLKVFKYIYKYFPPGQIQMQMYLNTNTFKGISNVNTNTFSLALFMYAHVTSIHVHMV